MWEISAKYLLPKALKSCPKSNKLPNLVTLLVPKPGLTMELHGLTINSCKWASAPFHSVLVCWGKPSPIVDASPRTLTATPTATRSASTTREPSTASRQEFQSKYSVNQRVPFYLLCHSLTKTCTTFQSPRRYFTLSTLVFFMKGIKRMTYPTSWLHLPTLSHSVYWLRTIVNILFAALERLNFGDLTKWHEPLCASLYAQFFFSNWELCRVKA